MGFIHFILLCLSFIALLLVPLGLRNWPSQATLAEIIVRSCIFGTALAIPVAALAYHSKIFMGFVFFLSGAGVAFLWSWYWLTQRHEAVSWVDGALATLSMLLGGDPPAQGGLFDVLDRRIAKRLDPLRETVVRRVRRFRRQRGGGTSA